MKPLFRINLILLVFTAIFTSCEPDKAIEKADPTKHASTELRGANGVLCCVDGPLSNPNVDCKYNNDACVTIVDNTLKGYLVTPQQNGSLYQNCIPQGYCWTALECQTAQYWYDYTSPYFYIDNGGSNCGGWSYGMATSAATTSQLNNVNLAFTGTNWDTGQPETQYCDLYFNYFATPDDGTQFSRSYWRHGIDSCDANMIDRYLSGQLYLTAWQRMAADADADGDIDPNDSELIRQLAGVTAVGSLPTCSVSGAVGLGTSPYLYVNQRAYHIAASNWAVNNDQVKITRLAYINERLPERLINTVTGCKVTNPWGNFNTAPYNYGLGKHCYVIKRGDVNASHAPGIC